MHERIKRSSRRHVDTTGGFCAVSRPVTSRHSAFHFRAPTFRSLARQICEAKRARPLCRPWLNPRDVRAMNVRVPFIVSLICGNFTRSLLRESADSQSDFKIPSRQEQVEKRPIAFKLNDPRLFIKQQGIFFFSFCKLSESTYCLLSDVRIFHLAITIWNDVFAKARRSGANNGVDSP